MCGSSWYGDDLVLDRLGDIGRRGRVLGANSREGAAAWVAAPCSSPSRRDARLRRALAGLSVHDRQGVRRAVGAPLRSNGRKSPVSS